jgi:hypothetical protein
MAYCVVFENATRQGNELTIEKRKYRAEFCKSTLAIIMSHVKGHVSEEATAFCLKSETKFSL